MNLQAAASPRPGSTSYFASHWRSLDYFNLYRLTLALALVFTGILFGDSELFSPQDGERFLSYAYAYLLCAALFVLGIRARWLGFPIQLTAHILTDIVFMVVLMSTNERLAGGLGLLLAISIASGGLVGSGRLTLFYAAIASIALLMQHTLSTLGGNLGTEGFFQIALLCTGYFAIGWLAHTLTQRALRSERLAQSQAEELALLDRINALAVENSPDGLLAIDHLGMVRHISPRARTLLGIAGPFEAGRTQLEACAPALAAVLPQRCARGEARELDLPGGRLRIRCIPVAPTNDMRILTLEDLGETEAEAQRQKLAALGRLTANIAHEIRNPLAAISQAAELLHEEPQDATQSRLTDIIGNNARRLDRLVEEILTLNRRDRLRPLPFDQAKLGNLIDELRQVEDIPESAIMVNMSPALRFSFDPDHLRQIVWNLLRNAWRHASRQPGCITLEAGVTGGGYLDVIDDGPGIAPEHRNKLFEPFFTTDTQGTGLGLFLARELAEANHATLVYVPGVHGARFRLNFARTL